MDSQVPTVSVLMPVYNAGRYLASAVESILAQTFRDFEFILIDDGSTDDSPTVLERMAAEDKRVRLVRRANVGLTKSLNECIRLARGRFLARMDGDDVSLPDRFERQVAFLDANPGVVLLGGSYDLIDGEGRLLRHQSQPTDDATLQSLCLSGRTPIAHPLAMMRADAVAKVGGYDEQFLVAQDLDLWLRLGEVGQMACLPQTLLHYRLHETSVSEKKQSMQVAAMKLACERAWARRGIRGGTFHGAKGWRPSSGRGSRHEYALKYGWWAFNAGRRRTAMIYGAKAIAAMPHRPAGWKLLACAALKSSRPTPTPVRT